MGPRRLTRPCQTAILFSSLSRESIQHHHGGPDAHQPEALPEQSDGQSSHGQTEVGTRVQRLPRLGRRLHEPAAANTEEYIDGGCTGNLGEVLVRCNNVLYIRGVEEDDEEGEMRD